MRRRPLQRFSSARAEAFLGPGYLDFALIYPTRDELNSEYTPLIDFHKAQTLRSGFQMRIEKTKRMPWLELGCWSRNASSDRTPSLCFRLQGNARSRIEIIQHLQRSEKIEVRFVCLEEEVGINNLEELEVIDKAISRIRSNHPCLAVGTHPIELRQLRIFGKIHRAPYAES